MSRTVKNVNIRLYQPADLEACRELWVALTDWHRQIYQSPGIGGDNPGLQFDEHLANVGKENLWVAEIDGLVVGLTGLIHREAECEVEPVVVQADFRGCGIGRRLVQTVIAEARARGIRQLSVRPVARNERAILFFHEMGFSILGHVELFMDFNPGEETRWQKGERLAKRDFRF